MTVLDTAHATMMAAPSDDTLRLRFLERVSDAELFLLLEAEPQGDQIRPRIFDLEDGPVVLAFDTEERLTEAAGGAAFAALSGRALVSVLRGQGIAIGLNLGVAASAYLMPADAVDWLAHTLDQPPEDLEARPDELLPPENLPEALLTALDAKLPGLMGLADWAGLLAVRYGDGRKGHLLAFVGHIPGAEDALARATREALVFSGLEAGALDVTCLKAGDPLVAKVERVALRFDIPMPETAPTELPTPGSDPDKPPKLR